MRLIKLSGLITVLFAISGCSSILPSITPIKNQVSEINVEPITYVFNNDTDISSLRFGDYHRTRRGDNWIENWGVKSTLSDNELLISKYIDNGVSGSTNDYFVKITKNDNNVTLTPFKNRINQDGLIMPKPVPPFTEQNLTEFLSSTRHEVGFEINSNFPSESINANFKRILSQNSLKSFNQSNEKIFQNTYFLTVDGAEAKIEVNTYPYRNGSKCTVKVVYYTKFTGKAQIELKTIENAIKEKVSGVVNS